MRQRHRVPLPRVLSGPGGVGPSRQRSGVPVRFPGHDPGRPGDRHGPGVRRRRRRPVGDLLQPGGHRRGRSTSRCSVGVELPDPDRRGVRGRRPVPGRGRRSRRMQNQWFVIPNVLRRASADARSSTSASASSRQYGLGPAVGQPETLRSGRFISQNAVIKSTRPEPDLLLQALPRSSRSRPARTTGSRRSSSSATGRHQPVHGRRSCRRRARQAQQRPARQRRLGLERRASCSSRCREPSRSAPRTARKIKVDYEGDGDVHPAVRRATPAFDALVAAQLPPGEHPVADLDRLSRRSLNIGVGIEPGQPCSWSARGGLDGVVPLPDASPSSSRRCPAATSTAPRSGRTAGPTGSGLEKKFGDWAVRVGYYYDNTPQPDFDVEPAPAPTTTATSTRPASATTRERWGVDVGGAATSSSRTARS